MKKIKIGYFGDGLWAYNALNIIIKDERFEIKFICGRFDSLDETLKSFAVENKIEFIRHKNVNSDEFLNLIRKFDCDLFVSMSFNQILKKQFIHLPPLKTINCHASKLPFYRGRNVLNWVLINDEKEFGITVHYVDEGIDTGDIILQKIYPISDEDDYKSILERAYINCANVLYEALINIYNDEVQVIKQADIHNVGFYCVRRIQGDEIIDWNQSSRDIFNFVRAICSPGPMALTHIDKEEVKINKVSLIKDAINYRLIPGTVIGFKGSAVIVKTADNSILIDEYYSKKRLKIGDRLK